MATTDPNIYTPTQRRNGGLKRAQTGRRHPVYKIFLPDYADPDENLFPSCYRHGEAGGKALLNKYGPEYFSNLAKKRSKKS